MITRSGYSMFIHVDVPSVDTQKLVGTSTSGVAAVSSKEIQKKVQRARDIQTKRFNHTKIKSNAEMNTRNVKEYCPLSPDCRTMMISATASMNLSARSYFKVIKIARTISDLANEKEISATNSAEALQYRPKDED